MQASTTLCCPYHSADANFARLLQSAGQPCPRRRTTPTSSFPNPSHPPIIRATGETKVDGLLLGCAQASSSRKLTTYSTELLACASNHNQPHIRSLSSSSTDLTLQLCKPFSERTVPASRFTLLSAPRAPIQISSSSDEDGYNHSLARQSCFSPALLSSRPPMNIVDNQCSVMIASHSAPGTPPELTESRSSKSSSCDSDFLGETDLSTTAADTHFEDIGLEDDHRPRVGQHDRYNQSAVQICDRKEIFHARQPSLSKINCRPRLANPENALHCILPGSAKGGFASSSSLTLTNQSPRPRSKSPPKRLARSMSSYSVDMSGSVHIPSQRPSFMPSRRASWQPQRKTIKELEAEYHESDDELPEDAALWNVPISPFGSTGPSPRTSVRGSPERESAVGTPLPLPLEHTQSVPDLSLQRSPQKSPRLNSSSTPRLGPRSSSVNLSHSNPTSPRMPGFLRNGRAKSWNLAMSDLSPEARVVSENLQHHACTSRSKEEDVEKLHSAAPQRSSAPSAIQLPSIQRGPLDFMPISKEKEAVLSRTRPSWLPPKDPKEEQRHLKQYQKMMAASIEAERKRDDRLKTVKSQEESTRESLNRIWDFYVNPTTDINIIDRRIHSLCWRGIPARVRGKVWQRAIGNPLGLSEKTYNKALERVKSIKDKNADELSQLERRIFTHFTDIDRDAETAFPELGVYHRNGPFWQNLVSLCQVYVCYRSDTGYFYGLQLIAALIHLQIPDPAEAFIFMANCLNRTIPMAFHTCDIAATQRTYNRVVSNLGVKFPRLHAYLFEPMDQGGLGFTGNEVMEPMFRTLFSNGLDIDRLCRVWDIWVFEGDGTLVRTAVALFGSVQSQIFDVAGDLHLKRRNVQEMLGWGPFNRSTTGSHWNLEASRGEEAFVDEIDAAGKLDYTGR